VAAASKIVSDKDSKGRHPECITPYEALRMVTVDAAFVIGLDDLIGSIEPGKLADFTILHDSPLTPKLKGKGQQLKDIKIWGTVLGGKPYPLKSRDGKTSSNCNLSYMDQVPEPKRCDRIYNDSMVQRNFVSKTCSFLQSILWLYCYTFDHYDLLASGTNSFLNNFFRRLILFFAQNVFKVPNITRRKPAKSSRSIIQRNIRANNLTESTQQKRHIVFFSITLLLVMRVILKMVYPINDFLSFFLVFR